MRSRLRPAAVALVALGIVFATAGAHAEPPALRYLQNFSLNGDPASPLGAWKADATRRIREAMTRRRAGVFRAIGTNNSAQTVVNFTVDRSGRLLGVAIVSGSGFAEADLAAVAAVRSVGRFPRYPLPNPTLSVTVPLRFSAP